jgi:transcriptional regulator with XRE-family HTH domain
MSDSPTPAAPPDLGHRLRQLRQKRGLTQGQLAAAVGVSRSAVAQWESGRAGQASLHLRRLADALGVQIDDLLLGEQHAIETVAQAGDERALLRLYRGCSASDRQLLLLMARRLGSTAAPSS